MKGTHIKAILDTRFPKGENKNLFPVRLRVTHERKRNYIYMGHDLTKEDWRKVEAPKAARANLKDIQIDIKLKEAKAEEIVKKLPVYTFERFKRLYTGEQKEYGSNIYSAFEGYIKALEKEGRIGTAISTTNALNSLKTFKRSLSFIEITPEFLSRYEKFMVANGKSLTTVGIYIRALRVIINNAIREGLQIDYPFGKGKYEIPQGRNIKKALTLKEINAIFNYNTLPGSPEDKARDMWKFSCLCNGINFGDLARLKYDFLKDEEIQWSRQKTIRTRKSNSSKIAAALTPEMKEIIDKWGTGGSGQDYIFDILPNEKITPQREKALINQFVKTTNKWMGRIASDLKIKKKVSTYVARHSYATVAKFMNIPIEYISESLGHSDLKTTQSYLASFEHDTRKKYALALEEKLRG